MAFILTKHGHEFRAGRLRDYWLLNIRRASTRVAMYGGAARHLRYAARTFTVHQEAHDGTQRLWWSADGPP